MVRNLGSEMLVKEDYVKMLPSPQISKSSHQKNDVYENNINLMIDDKYKNQGSLESFKPVAKNRHS